MIINHTSVHLLQMNQQASSFKERQLYSQGDKLQDALASNENNRLMLSQQHQLEFQHRQSDKFHSSVSIQQAEKPTVNLIQNRATSELVNLSLTGESAKVANMQNFPAASLGSSQSELKVLGKAEFHVMHKLDYQSDTHSQMSASGKVSLEDGREIDFSLFVAHQGSTRLSAVSELSLTSAALHDPLVINFGADSVQLQNQFFDFDLNADGDTARFASLAHGSGYLAFDMNGDGQVNDGSELFGTQSGNGFKDLAQFDEDGNGWIDEKDSIYSKLSLWTNQADANSLTSLNTIGVGAIYLDNVAQTGEFRSDSGALLGQSKYAGIVLMENGDVKTAQSIDLARVAEIDPDRKTEQDQLAGSLAEVVESLNAVQNQRQMAQRDMPMMPFPKSESEGFQPNNAWEDMRNFFKEMEENIAKLVAQRKAMLEKIEAKYS